MMDEQEPRCEEEATIHQSLVIAWDEGLISKEAMDAAFRWLVEQRAQFAAMEPVCIEAVNLVIEDREYTEAMIDREIDDPDDWFIWAGFVAATRHYAETVSKPLQIASE